MKYPYKLNKKLKLTLSLFNKLYEINKSESICLFFKIFAKFFENINHLEEF